MTAARPCPICGTAAEEVWAGIQAPAMPAPVLAAQAEQWRKEAPFPVAPLVYDACGACGVAFSRVAPDLQARIDALYAGIAYGSAQLAGLSGLADRIISRLVEDGVDGKAVLEIGCADGTLLERLAGLGARVRGIEPGALAAARCAEKGIPVEQRPFHPDQPLDGPACDAIILRNIIEHTPDPVSWLRRLASALHPRGRLFLETPNASWFARKGDWSLLSFLHPVLFSPRGLTLACAQAGLTGRVIDADGPALLVEARPAASMAAVPPEAEALPTLDCTPRIEAAARVLTAWRDAGHPFFVWGAGTFAGGLLAAIPAMAAAMQCHAGAMTFPEPVAYLHDPIRISPIPPAPMPERVVIASQATAAILAALRSDPRFAAVKEALVLFPEVERIAITPGAPAVEGNA